MFGAIGARLVGFSKRLEREQGEKQSQAKGRKLAELEVGVLAAAEALEKGKAAVAAVAEEC